MAGSLDLEALTHRDYAARVGPFVSAGVVDPRLPFVVDLDAARRGGADAERLLWHTLALEAEARGLPGLDVAAPLPAQLPVRHAPAPGADPLAWPESPGEVLAAGPLFAGRAAPLRLARDDRGGLWLFTAGLAAAHPGMAATAAAVAARGLRWADDGPTAAGLDADGWQAWLDAGDGPLPVGLVEGWGADLLAGWPGLVEATAEGQAPTLAAVAAGPTLEAFLGRPRAPGDPHPHRLVHVADAVDAEALVAPWCDDDAALGVLCAALRAGQAPALAEVREAFARHRVLVADHAEALAAAVQGALVGRVVEAASVGSMPAPETTTWWPGGALVSAAAGPADVVTVVLPDARSGHGAGVLRRALASARRVLRWVGDHAALEAAVAGLSPRRSLLRAAADGALREVQAAAEAAPLSAPAPALEALVAEVFEKNGALISTRVLRAEAPELFALLGEAEGLGLIEHVGRSWRRRGVGAPTAAARGDLVARFLATDEPMSSRKLYAKAAAAGVSKRLLLRALEAALAEGRVAREGRSWKRLA